jgi:hypothetical protein
VEVPLDAYGWVSYRNYAEKKEKRKKKERLPVYRIHNENSSLIKSSHNPLF